MNIEGESTFKRYLQDKINLFLGAGFSIISKDNNKDDLPLGDKLAEELSRKFELEKTDLYKISTILEMTRKVEFYQYLTERFRVVSNYEKYKVLDRLNIKKIFTTNIDDLVYKIFENNTKHYINNVTLSGPVFNDECAIDYYPLHGSIRDSNKRFVFSVNDINRTYIDENDVWQTLRQSISKEPILFLGYGFNDAGVFQALYGDSKFNNNQKPKWILLKDPQKIDIDYFKALGFFIITGTINEFLDYIDNLKFSKKINNNIKNEAIEIPKEMCIPKHSDVPAAPLKDFYLGDEPQWYNIYSGDIPHTSHYRTITNLIDSGENVIVTSIPASGKTTTLMQLASEYESDSIKLILKFPTKEKVQYIINTLKGRNAIIFIDNFTDDIDSIECLFTIENIQVVAFDIDYSFETVSHRMHKYKYKLHNMSELEELDIQKIIESIPKNIKKDSIIQKTDNSLFEIINRNVRVPNLQQRYKKFILDLDSNNSTLAELFVMICYVHSCRIPVSFDMAYSFLRDDITEYKDVYDMINNLGKLVKNLENTSTFNLIDDDQQDYFFTRSAYLSKVILWQLSKKSKILKRVLEKFLKNVSPYNICRFDIFKRKAYDSKIISEAFDNWREGMEYYEKLYNRDNSEYLLQQGALYLSSKGEYSKAFEWIDKALNNSKKEQFTIQNTHAIILFKSNIEKEDDESGLVKRTLDKSMGILEKCYQDDKRKGFHAVVFAEQALKYENRFGIEESKEYLLLAQNWLNIENVKDLNSTNTKKEIFKYLVEINKLI